VSIFDNPDFLSIQPLDLENKLYKPTAQLFVHVKQQTATVYDDLKDVLLETHRFISVEANQVYEHPGETLNEWYRIAIENGTTTYQEVVPKLAASYQQIETGLIDLNAQSKAFWTAFYADPEAFSVSLIEPLLAQLNGLMAQSQSHLSLLAGQVETYLINTYTNLLQVSELLMQQPVNTLNAVYQNSLAALLDIYAHIISSLLTLA
jgi:hypothetical protein